MDPWQPDHTDPRIVGYDRDGRAYPAFRSAQGPQVFNIASPADSGDDGQVSSATAAQHRIRAMQRSDITHWESGSRAGHNRPPTTGVPIVDCQENGEWPSPADIASRKRKAEREKMRREQEQVRAAEIRREATAQAQAGRTSLFGSRPNTCWVAAFMEAGREQTRAEEANFAQRAGPPKKPPPTTPPWIQHLPHSGSPTASQGRNYQPQAPQPHVSSAASSSAGPGISSGSSPSPIRPTNQSSYATKLLEGNDGAGILHEAFTEAIKRDIARYSDLRVNQYILKYYDARTERGEPMIAEYALHTYDTSVVRENAMHEFTLASQGRRDARGTNLAEYSVSILYLVAHSTALFPWTRELLKRHPTKDEEEQLCSQEETYRLLLSYGRSLVYYFRHGGGCRSGHASLLDISQVNHSWEFRLLTFRCPSLLAVLLSCCYKIRLSITMGVQDIYAVPEKICSIGFITCTHGHGNSGSMPASVTGLTWTPHKDERIIAVHGTSPYNWKSIIDASALMTIDRDSIHFTVFRLGMVLREMSQLKKRGRFLINYRSLGGLSCRFYHNCEPQ